MQRRWPWRAVATVAVVLVLAAVVSGKGSGPLFGAAAVALWVLIIAGLWSLWLPIRRRSTSG